MRNPFAAALAAALLFGAGHALAAPPHAAGAQAADTPAAREAAARTLFGPLIRQAAESQIREIRSVFRQSGVSDPEATALENAFDVEIGPLLTFAEQVMAEAAARHVPLDQIRADADFDSPAWTAAGDETAARLRAATLEVVLRMTESGCAVQAEPSPRCAELLGRVADYRAGRLSAAEFLRE